MADAAGLISTGINVAGGLANERQQKNINRSSRRMTKRNRAAALSDLDQAGKQLNRQANQAMTDTSLAAAGGDDGEGTSANYYSSQRKDSINKIEGERKLRQDAIGRQRALMESNWHDEDKIYKAQKKMARTQKYMALANSLLSSGVGGMGM